MTLESNINFACPVCKNCFGDQLLCKTCDRSYPEVNGVPVLINEQNSVFDIADYVHRENAYRGASDYAGHLDNRTGIRQLYRRFIKIISESSPPKREYDVNDAIDYLLSKKYDIDILVIGAGDTLLKGKATYTDVAFGKNVLCIADAHDLPFPDKSFDVCVICAVLEHVIDPHRCVSEIIRVLRPNGYVYAETPFMQPVHMREHDFTRFTYLGHRRLFRYFDEVRSGIVGGPGISAGQLLRYAIAATSDQPEFTKWLKLIGLIVTYPFRWVDNLCYGNLSAYDSASGFYFFGSLRKEPISDRELLKAYRGGQSK